MKELHYKLHVYNVCLIHNQEREELRVEINHSKYQFEEKISHLSTPLSSVWTMLFSYRGLSDNIAIGYK